MKTVPHYKFALVPGKRCVSHEVARRVRRLPRSGPGPVDADSHPGSTANEQCDWDKSLNPSRPQAQERWHGGQLCSGSTGHTSQRSGVILCSCWQATGNQADQYKVSASSRCPSRTPVRRSAVAGRGAGCARDRRVNDSVTNTCLTEHRQDEKENSSVVNIYVENNGERVTQATWYYACNRSDFSTKQKFQMDSLDARTGHEQLSNVL